MMKSGGLFNIKMTSYQYRKSHLGDKTILRPYDRRIPTIGFPILYLITCFNLFWKNILSVMYADWGPLHLSLAVCYIFRLLIPLIRKTWFYKDCNRNCKNPVLDVKRTLGTSNQAIYYNLLSIYFSSFINLDTLIIMSPKIDGPYLWTRPLYLVPLNLTCGLL